jgi:hypothetical protein
MYLIFILVIIRYTFEVSPVFTVMEKALLQKMLNLIGFKDGDAIFTPGMK